MASDPTGLVASQGQDTVRSFWHSGVLGTCQLLAFKSFADRGYAVEVFSYDPSVDLPGWIVRRNAADVLPPERVLRYLPERGRFAVNIDRFRYALLAQFGGWWIEPDVVLLAEQLPDAELFIVCPNEFSVASTAALKFPVSHPVSLVAAEFAASRADRVENWQDAGASYLTELIERHGLSSLCRHHAMVSPISWFDTAALFDKSRARAVGAALKAGGLILDLHQEAWISSGAPPRFRPPDGSVLDLLLQRHNISAHSFAPLHQSNWDTDPRDGSKPDGSRKG